MIPNKDTMVPNTPAFTGPLPASTLANPTALVGVTAVNGVAATAMRSDAAPAYDPNAAYVFTGLGNTTLLSTSTFTVGAGITLTGSNGKISATGNIQSNNNFVLNSNTGSYNFGAGNDVILTRGGGAAKLQLGDQNAASPVAQTLQAQGSRAGTDSNIGGANLTDQPGTGTGTGTLAQRIFKTPRAVGSGSGAQTQATALTMVDGVTWRPGIAFASLPSAPQAGMEAYITDSTTNVWGATIAGSGAIPVLAWYNGANWTVMGK